MAAHSVLNSSSLALASSSSLLALTHAPVWICRHSRAAGLWSQFLASSIPSLWCSTLRSTRLSVRLTRLETNLLSARYRVIVRKRRLERHHPATPMGNAPSTEAEPAGSLPAVRPPPTNFDTIVLEPKGEHRATIVWLHGLGGSGESWANGLKSDDQLHPDIKWIVPTASIVDVEIFDDPCTAWFNATPIHKEGHFVDLEGLDKSAELVADLFLKDMREDGSKKVKLVIGGFSQGCATALYIVRCSIRGKYSNGKPFPIKLDGAIGLSGWMPAVKSFEDEVNRTPGERQRAGELPVFFGHCEDDDKVPITHTRLSTSAFCNVGFNDLTIKMYPKGGHTCIPEETQQVRQWIISRLGLGKGSKV